MTTSHKTKWREARMQIQQEKDKYPSRFYDDVMTIYHRDGTKTEVVHPFDAMKQCKERNR